ncbi:MAG: SixA phosphatase family protein, partial [Marinirhabdus sp.]
MKTYLLAAFALQLLISCGNNENRNDTAANPNDTLKTTTYYLIRHAEKDRSGKGNSDPNLTNKGVQRAKKWAVYFKGKKIEAVYTTNYNRTRQTASYTAQMARVPVKTYDPTKLYSAAFKAATWGKTVLVVGHSNTTPQFVNAIIGENKYSNIPDNENNWLFKVTLTANGKTK